MAATPPLIVGGIGVHRIVDIDPFALPLNFLFPDGAIEALAPQTTLLEGPHIDFAAATVLLAVQSHLVRIGGKTILIDACVGEHKPRPARPDWNERSATGYLGNLAAAGCTPADIDVVMCTHLHADHVGWNTTLESGRWVPTFPNARYVMSEREARFRAEQASVSQTADHGSFRDSVLPILEAGLATMADEGDEIAEGTRIVALPGHAPGQIGIEMTAGSTRLMFCGDAVHSPAQVICLEWSSRFCHDPQLAQKTRRALLERCAGDDFLLLPAHLRAGAMRISDHPDGFRPAFVD
jgi:glyoxylase-like metal-dependent hydrolase (beta-lactamase superfamily II)